MANKVPVSGYKMFTDVDSIHKVVEEQSGATIAENFNAILDVVHAETGDISFNRFDPTYRPASLALVNESDHFRNFPRAFVACLNAGTNADAVCCEPIGSPCPPPDGNTDIDAPFEGEQVTLIAGTSANDACCTLLHF